MPGVETARFKVQPINPNFVCSICRGVFVEPVQRPSCQHIFCKDCITNWLVHQHNCPIDRQPLTKNYLVEAPRVLRELIGELEVRCEYFTRGCDHYGRLDKVDTHATTCPYNPNYHTKAKFENILRAKEIMSGSHSCVSQLLNILEEKEKLVKEQERLITKILEEGEDINKLMREFTDEKQKMQKAREEDMERFKEVIAKLQIENEELKVRLNENRSKLLKDCFGDDPWTPVPPVPLPGPPSRPRTPETLKVENVPAIRDRSRSKSSDRNASPATHRRNSKSITNEHRETMKKLKSKFPDKVYRAMQQVDLGAFYDIEPYKLSWASYVGERVKREAIYVKEGHKVLVMCCWSDLYIPTCLAMIVGPNGCVVTRGYAQPEIDRVKKDYSYLIDEERLVIVLEDEDDSLLKEGYPAKSPFDVIFVSKEHFTDVIEEQRKPDGLAFDPYTETDLTPGNDNKKLITYT